MKYSQKYFAFVLLSVDLRLIQDTKNTGEWEKAFW